ncbi:MAG TPA: protoporphyrinogen oxidase HemJ [Cellvibrionaceae bacterium]|nr:protoporphyrinogen oxidase HemJ [Cellvibrionaceae bacterium]HMW47614.1 protoporphyrinogen oxidase HemJ [Cellvibrionaceae bacterium]
MLWLKAFHIVAFTSWFAMLFYLPRLFVYHQMADDAASKERFSLMEHKLYKVIGTPAMLVTLLLGISMAGMGWDYYKTQGWFHAKMLLVFFLIGYHHMCGAFVKKLAAGTCTKSHRFFRIFNEVPVVFLILIAILVIVKPF